jgi:type IV pilus assembly protein PilE
VRWVTIQAAFPPLVPLFATFIGKRWQPPRAGSKMLLAESPTHKPDGAPMKSCHKGFTVIELMITVVIIAILAAVAIPSYRDYILRGKLVDAHNGLSDFRVRMEQFYQDNRRYDGGGLGGCGAAAPTSKYFTFTCAPAAAPAQTYVATATGIAGEGMSGFAYTINETNARATVVTAPATTNGWSSNAACWIRAKPNVC